METFIAKDREKNIRQGEKLTNDQKIDISSKIVKLLFEEVLKIPDMDDNERAEACGFILSFLLETFIIRRI